MAALEDQLTLVTDLFEHREVKPHFINDCCFGEDFAAWLRGQVASLEADGFALDPPIQEDYGWGFWISRGKETFWVALGYTGDGPAEDAPEWVVIIKYEAGPNLLKWLFHRPDAAAFATVRDRLFTVLKTTPGIRVLD